MKLCVCVGALAFLLSGCMSQEQWSQLLNGPYPLQVDYSRSIEDSLSAGRYDWVSSQLASVSFPSSESGRGGISTVLVPFAPQASLEHLLQREAAAGLRPATFKELLAFGEAYPEVQRKLSIVALGSSAGLMVTIYQHIFKQDASMGGFTIVEHKMEPVYPYLGDGLFGRSVHVEWLDDPDAYPMYYACFVQPQ